MKYTIFYVYKIPIYYNIYYFTNIMFYDSLMKVIINDNVNCKRLFRQKKKKNAYFVKILW